MLSISLSSRYLAVQTVLNKAHQYRYYILAIFFLLHLFHVWPGTLEPDSNAQYQQAILGQYGDHHPPMMSFVWHYMLKLCDGPGLMLSLQLSFIYISVALLLHIQNKLIPDAKNIGLLILCFPFYPQILIYSHIILKDSQFTFSFLLASTILAYYTLDEKKPSWYMLLCWLVLVIYGAAVKYQGQFCAIVLAIWMGSLLRKESNLLTKLISGLAIYAVIFGSIHTINNILVPQKEKSNAWQYVKLYDLAAISIATKEDLIPTFNKTLSFTVEKLTSRFKYPAVDPYIYSEDNILRSTKIDSEMRILEDTWWSMVLKHPMYYMKHRAINMAYTLLSRPGYTYAEHIFNNVQGFTGKFLRLAVGATFFVFMSHFPIIFAGVIFWLFSIYAWRKSKAAPILFANTSVTLLLIAILFFKSMAGIPRYTYFSIVIILASVLFAYKCWLDVQKR